MKARITLRYKTKRFGTKMGETVQIFNDIFDKQNGVAFNEIEKDVYDIVEVDLFTTFIDINGKEIYVGDKVSAKMLPHITPNTVRNGDEVVGEVVFDMGAMCIKIEEINNRQFDIGSTPCMFDFDEFEIIP